MQDSDINIPLTSSSSGGVVAVLTIAPACRGETVPLVLRGATYRRVAHYKVFDPSALPAMLLIAYYWRCLLNLIVRTERALTLLLARSE